MLSKNFRKFLFFWVIFHTVGYASYLLDFHPSIKSESGYGIDTSYILTPEPHTYGSDHRDDESGFYPFHDFTEKSWMGSYTYTSFLGIYGYYGTSEYALYVISPLFIIVLIWVYRKYISPPLLEQKKPENKKDNEERNGKIIAMISITVILALLAFGKL